MVTKSVGDLTNKRSIKMELDIQCNCCEGELDIYTEGPQITFECLDCGKTDYRFMKSRKKRYDDKNAASNSESSSVAA
jgi:predicted RNA-binding Zn-ribbon protein involved in translation (DUF1610 family)